jgi:HSP20 family protein
MYNLEFKSRRPFWGQSFFDLTQDQKSENYFTPACDIQEEEGRFAISLDIPGLKREDISLEIKDNHLYVSGERKWESSTQKENVLRVEKRYGKFSRVFTLPQNVNPDMIEAHFENGVLDIFLPKEEKAQTRKISISEKRSESIN